MKPSTKGRRIRTLEQLEAVRLSRGSVLVRVNRYGTHRYPAAFVMCRSALCVLHMIQNGMFLYIPKKPTPLDAPVRKFRTPNPPPNPPVYRLPYYPEIKS